MAAPHEHGPSSAARESRAATWDRWSFAVAFGVWLAATIWTFVFVALYTTPIPAADDLELVAMVDPDWTPTWTYFWAQANEHRILLPRVVYYGLLQLTHDFRAAMHCQVFVQSVLALSLILFVRRLRGRSSFADAFFPLLLLSWGEAGNLVLGLQIATAFATALVCVFVMLAMRRPGPPTRWTAVAMAVCMLLMTLDGGFGLMQLPALMLWAAGCAWWLLRRPDSASKKTGGVLAAGILLALGVTAFYFVGFFFPPALPHSRNPLDILRTALQFLSVNFGPTSDTRRLFCQTLTVLFVGAALFVAVRAWWRGTERWRAAAVLCGMGASFTIALSIGVSRGALADDSGLSNRYVILAAPVFLVAYLGLSLLAPRWLERTAQGVMCLALVAVLPANFDFGYNYGTFHRYLGKHLVENMRNGVPLPEYAQAHFGGFYPDPEGFLTRFEVLRRAKHPPFVDITEDPEWGGLDEKSMFIPRPRSIETPKSLIRTVYGARSMTLRADSAIVLEAFAGATELEATYGMLPIAWEGTFTNDAHSGGIRVSVEFRPEKGEPRVLFERELQPHARAEDRGVQKLKVAIPEERPAELVLMTRHLTEKRRQLDWSFWREVFVH
jgi:hypothetical protein